MKKKQCLTLQSLILLGLSFLSGCSAVSSLPAKPTISPDYSPTLSTTQIFTPQPTSIPTPTLTLTSGPTVSVEQLQTNILAALETKSGCKLPCWWGITPGQTFEEDALALLRQIGFTPILYTEGGWYFNFLIFTPTSEGNNISYEVHLQNQIVNNLKVMGEGYTNRNRFRGIWDNFSPESIIIDYGTPSRAWLETEYSSCEGSGSCKTIPYSLWLFYDVQGFLIHYSGSIDYLPTYTFCPTFGGIGNLGDSIGIYIKSPEDEKSLESLTGFPPIVLENSKDIVGVTGMSLDKFSAHYRQTDQPFCFSTPRDIWP